MTRPLRENLDVAEYDGAPWVRCARCRYRLAPMGEEWRTHCISKQLSPSNMGPHRELLEGKIFLREHYCPGCGVTLDATFIATEGEQTLYHRPRRRDGGKSVSPQPITLN